MDERRPARGVRHQAQDLICEIITVVAGNFAVASGCIMILMKYSVMSCNMTPKTHNNSEKAAPSRAVKLWTWESSTLRGVEPLS